MVLAPAHLFGFYNPKPLADFLAVPHQSFYTQLKDWSLYHLKQLLIRFMVKQAAEQLGAVLDKSNATRSRAGLSLSIDNSVIDRLGKFLRCTWSWYSGRCKKVVQGQDLFGLVLTINQVALPVHRLFGGCLNTLVCVNKNKPVSKAAMIKHRNGGQIIRLAPLLGQQIGRARQFTDVKRPVSNHTPVTSG